MGLSFAKKVSVFEKKTSCTIRRSSGRPAGYTDELAKHRSQHKIGPVTAFSSRRSFLKTAGLMAGSVFLPTGSALAESSPAATKKQSSDSAAEGVADHTVRITRTPIEIAKNRIISLTTYGGQFPGPLLRLKEGQQITVDIHNETDVPEQLHWHGQMIP